MSTARFIRCVKLPKYAIANGAIIGDAPVKLTSLNDIKLALVSIARINKHIFTFYGGAHKSMRGWHNLYKNNFEHIVGALQQIESLRGGSSYCWMHSLWPIYCVPMLNSKTTSHDLSARNLESHEMDERE